VAAVEEAAAEKEAAAEEEAEASKARPTPSDAQQFHRH
jgi:hypothetical protein